MLFEAALQAAQNLHGLLDAGLGHVDLLESTRQRVVFLEDAAVFGVGGRADALELARGQRRLEQVGRVQRAARGRAGADQRVNLVDEQDGVGIAADLLEHALQALLEIAAVLGAGQQRAHVQRVDLRGLQDLGHFAARDAPGQALGDGGLAHAGLADQQRVVLAAAAQHLDDTLDLVLASDQGIDAAGQRGGVQVIGILIQRRLTRFALVFPVALLLFLHGGGLHLWLFGNAMRQEIDHVQARHALLLQVIDGVRVLFAENGDEHIGARDGFLAGAARRHMHDRALDHALETQRGLRVDFRAAGNHGRVFRDELAQVAAQVVQVRGAGAQNLDGRSIVEQGQQQMLDGDEFVPGRTGLDESHMQADFKLLRNHASSDDASKRSNTRFIFYADHGVTPEISKPHYRGAPWYP